MKGKKFIVLDCEKGFWQLPIKAEDRAQLAFQIDGQKFHYCRLPFGYKNAPRIFQKENNDVLEELYKVTVVYIDDTVIFGVTWIELLQAFRQVLEKLEKCNVKISISKLQLCM